MRSNFILLPVMLTLAACNVDYSEGGGGSQQDSDPATRTASASGGDSMSSSDPKPGEDATTDIPDAEERPTMQLQVVLDRLGFTPGVVDGKIGSSTRNAISGYQEANDLTVTGKLNEETRQKLAEWSNIPATRVVTIPAAFADQEYTNIPESAAEKAKLKNLGYTSLDEKLAERFHTTVDTLKMLNPGGVPAGAQKNQAASKAKPGGGAPSPDASRTASASPSPAASAKAKTGTAQASFFKAGQQIRVPNVGADRIAASASSKGEWMATLRSLGVGSEQQKASRVVVSKSQGTLKVYDENDELIGMYTATMGSQHDPLPLGNWKVTGVAHNPPFAYDPELFWDVPDDKAKQQLPPGPNGPVGVVWIDLSKEHYGIHGTPEPQTIGRAQSHGCVRLTNWDAARLAQMVSPGTAVIFEA